MTFKDLMEEIIGAVKSYGFQLRTTRRIQKRLKKRIKGETEAKGIYGIDMKEWRFYRN